MEISKKTTGLSMCLASRSPILPIFKSPGCSLILMPWWLIMLLSLHHVIWYMHIYIYAWTIMKNNGLSILCLEQSRYWYRMGQKPPSFSGWIFIPSHLSNWIRPFGDDYPNPNHHSSNAALHEVVIKSIQIIYPWWFYPSFWVKSR